MKTSAAKGAAGSPPGAGRYATTPVLVAGRGAAHQIDHAREIGQRPLHHQRNHAEPVPDRGHCPIEVGARPVHLVDERDPGHAVPVGLPPDRLALRFDAGDRVEDRDRAVEYAQ